MKRFFEKIVLFLAMICHKIAEFFRRFSRKTYETLAICLLALILVADVGYHFSRGLTSDLETMPARVATLCETLESDAYLIREETLLSESGGKYIYHVDEGERVSEGVLLATVYPESASDELIDTLSAYLQSQKLLESVKNDRPEKISETLELRIAGVTLAVENAMREGNLRQAAIEKESLDALLYCREALAGASDISALLSALSGKIASVQSLLGEPVRRVYATEPCWFSRMIDGYEGYASSNEVESMDHASLAALFEEKDVSVSSSVGKMISSHYFYLVTFVDAASAQLFSLNRKYNVTFDGEALSLTLEKVLYQNGEDGVALVFSCTSLSKSLPLRRIARMTLTVEEHTGFKIPTAALSENDGVMGVYILKGFVVEFREIAMSYRDDNTMILEEKPEEPSGKFKLLSQNENVIIKGEDLYDGKIVKDVS